MMNVPVTSIILMNSIEPGSLEMTMILAKGRERFVCFILLLKQLYVVRNQLVLSLTWKLVRRQRSGIDTIKYHI